MWYDDEGTNIMYKAKLTAMSNHNHYYNLSRGNFNTHKRNLNMKIKIKKLHNEAVIPTYAKHGDAGMDLTAISCEWDIKSNCFVYGTGLAFEIPKGYVGLLFPRSSICNQDLSLSNSVGVLDSGYRGEVFFKFKETLVDGCNKDGIIYKEGDRVGQILIIPYPQIEFEVIEELSLTERGTGGYGSTGI